MDALSRLQQTVPPPAEPAPFVGSRALPPDFEALLTVYGPGSFDGSARIYAPGAADPEYDLDAITAQEGARDDGCELIAWGLENVDDLFWRVDREDPASWKVVRRDREERTLEVLPGTATDLLAEIFLEADGGRRFLPAHS